MPLDPATIRTTAGRALDAADALKRALQPLTGDLSRTTDDGIRQAFATVSGRQAALEDATRDLAALFGAAPLSFADFLTDVGVAAVDTQRRLEVANLGAIAQARELGLQPSGLFKLPRLTGEVKFSFAETSSKKLGLILASRSHAEETRNEQSLSFEIVSVPLPPELAQASGPLVLATQPVLAPAERDPVLEALLAPDTVLGRDEQDPTKSSKTEPTSYVGKEPEAALVFRVPPETAASKDRFIVLFAVDSDKDEDTDKVGMWEVEPATRTVRIIWQINSSGSARNEDINRLRLWIRALAERQKKWLALAR